MLQLSIKEATPINNYIYYFQLEISAFTNIEQHYSIINSIDISISIIVKEED